MQTGSAFSQRRSGKPNSGNSSYAGRPITKHPNWASPTALDIWFNNLSIGTFLTAALGALLAPASFAGVIRYAYPLALVLLVIDLALLVTDLGDPLRFHHMLRVFKPSSPMSFGTWSLTGYGIFLGLASVIAVLSWPLFAGFQALLAQAGIWNIIEWLGKAAAVVAILPAMGGILYKGVLFSVSSQPGWKDARWLGGYIGNSAILMGASVVLLLAFLSGQTTAVTALRPALLALLVIDAVLLSLLYRNLRPTSLARFDRRQRTLVWIVMLLVGMLAPFTILLIGAPLIVVPLLLLAPALVARFVLVFL